MVLKARELIILKHSTLLTSTLMILAGSHLKGNNGAVQSVQNRTHIAQDQKEQHMETL
jgi:hypothetical protein